MGRLDAESETLIPVNGGGFDEALAFDARQSEVCIYGDRTGALDTDDHSQAIVFDETQITSDKNYSNPKSGDPSHPLAAGARPPTIAFSCKDHGADATAELAPTMRAMPHSGSHPNAGGQLAIAYDILGTPATNGGKETDIHVALRSRTPGSSEASTTTVVCQQAYSIMPQNSGKDYKARPVDVSQPVMAAGPTGGNQGGDYIATQWAVRRLTPEECEKLQGVPVGYTRIPWRGKPAEQCPDGPRYKALGNSWAVPVVRWIGKRMLENMP